MKHVLILGSTGFIGSALLNAFMNFDDSTHHFHLLVRNDKGQNNQKNTTVYTGNIENFDWSKLTHAPDIIYHLARINSTKGKKWGRKWAAHKGKKANERLLRHFSNEESAIQLIYLSGSLMYGNSDSVILESKSTNPISFAREYINAETPFIKHQEKRDSNLNITLVRVPWVLGFGSWFKGFYLTQLSSDKKVSVYDTGANKMAFVTLSDLANCLTKVPGVSFKEILNIGYPEAITQLEFAEIISEITGFPIEQRDLSNFESAIQEAFKSNIELGTQYTDFNEILLRSAVKQIVRSELRFLLENV